MTTFGITPSGFQPMLVDDIESNVDTAMRTNVDPNMDMSAAQPLGQMKSAIATVGALLFEVAATCYSGINPANAEGFVLDGVCAFTGTLREQPVYSTVIGSMTLNASTTVPVGSAAAVSGQLTNTWLLLGTGDPATGLLVTAGPVVSTGAGTYYGLFQATTPGATHANAGQLTVISTAVSGWTAITNVAAEVTGAPVESDSALSVRRESELDASGGATTLACRSDLLTLLAAQGIVNGNAYVFENDGDVTDSNGVPPHSMHALVFDGLSPNTTLMDPLIAAVVWKNKPSGGQTYGAVTTNVTDSSNALRAVSFDRATISRVYQAITVKTDSTFDVVNGPLAVQNALVSYWESVMALNVAMNRNLGDVLILNPLYAVKGVTDVTAFTLATTPTPVAVINLPASQYGIYTLAAADIAVTVT